MRLVSQMQDIEKLGTPEVHQICIPGWDLLGLPHL